MSRLRLLLSLLACLLLAACGETRYVMHLDPQRLERNTERTWPDLPQVPRYRYAGQLFGEDNFARDEKDSGVTAREVFNWLVGIFGMNDGQKIVLKRPQSGTVDAEGRILVTDVSNHAVFVFDQANGKLAVWDRAEELRRFVTPVGITPGPRGEILVADADLGLVIRLDHDGKPLGSFGKNILERPTGLARDGKRGRIYVSDTHSHDIKVFDDDGRLLKTIGRRGEEDGEMNFPTHITFKGDKLYVSDSMNARLLIFDADGKLLRTFGQRGIHFGDFTRPKGVAADSTGNIYVIESYYDQLLVFDKDGQYLMPIGGTGAEIGKFYLPSGVWSDDHDRIFVADMFNGRVMIFQFLGND